MPFRQAFQSDSPLFAAEMTANGEMYGLSAGYRAMSNPSVVEAAAVPAEARKKTSAAKGLQVYGMIETIIACAPRCAVSTCPRCEKSLAPLPLNLLSPRGQNQACDNCFQYPSGSSGTNHTDSPGEVFSERVQAQFGRERSLPQSLPHLAT